MSDERRSVMELTVTVCRLLGVAPPAGARGRPMVPAEDAAVLRPSAGGSCLVVLWAPGTDARILAAARAAVPARRRGCSWSPSSGCGRATRSPDAPNGRAGGGPALRAQDPDAALRAAAALARERGHHAVALVEVERGDARDLPALLGPVAEGRCAHVQGSARLTGARGAWPGRARDRVAAAWLGAQAPHRRLGPAARPARARPAGRRPARRRPDRPPGHGVLARAGLPALELPAEAGPARTPAATAPTPALGLPAAR